MTVKDGFKLGIGFILAVTLIWSIYWFCYGFYISVNNRPTYNHSQLLEDIKKMNDDLDKSLKENK